MNKLERLPTPDNPSQTQQLPGDRPPGQAVSQAKSRTGRLVFLITVCVLIDLGVKLLMRMSDHWTTFMDRMDEYYPLFGKTLRLPFGSGVPSCLNQMNEAAN